MEHEFWTECRKKFGKETDLTNFKNWEVSRRLPLYNPYELQVEYAADVKKLLAESSWRREWMEVIAKGEPRKGHGSSEEHASVHFDFEGTRTSAWCMKTMHHILTFEKMRGRSIIDYSEIVEIGAGIGETARMIFDRGFKGNYHIVDFPEVSKISSYYLDNRSQVVEDIKDLPPKMKNRGLFIATWSLSETPFAYRDQVAERLRGFDQLLLFQSQFKELSNPKYFFETWPYKSEIFYRIKQLEFHRGDGGNMYMIGKSVYI